MKTATKTVRRKRGRKKSPGRKAVRVTLANKVTTYFKEQNDFWASRFSRFLVSLAKAGK